ncbi:type VII secretion integral membrane protein EccD [Nocardia macrotermitis]|uniref:ESX-5 secretion system protein EccD5 n=1 Tax=Nocardia macrotermitis TaxID=2585198 RepID=A0A7K0D1J3_9NOCA|nr:type VII secretion integral membrane protein EccD [Nocardia macrotermitis]MQY19590.1 ESX-5 secretion system protein EccD5 [Nocardia macrotermitis]
MSHIEDDSTRGIVRAPDLARVTILAKHTQVDMAIPVDVPVALVIPSVVDMVAQHSRTNDFDQRGEQFQPAEWVLARIGQPPFSNSLSLGEQGVRDGELLMLESADHVAPMPLYDDIMYNVAIADGDNFRTWSPRMARISASTIAVLTMIVGCVGLLAAPNAMPGWISGAVAALLTILLVVAGTVLSRMYGDISTAIVIGGSALPTAFAAGMLLVPLQHHQYGWANVLLGSVLFGATAVLAWRVSGVGLALFIGATTVSLFAVVAALVGLLAGQPIRAVGAGAAVLALGGLSLAPRASMLLAKLPLPPVPSPGTPIDPTEDDPDDHRALPTMDVLREKAERARMYLGGMVGATTLVTVVGSLAGCDPGHHGGPFWAGIALALVSAVVLLFRSRTYTNAELAVVLIGGGAAILLAVMLGAAFTQSQPLAVFGAAMILLIGALICGLIIPNQTATPPMRRAVELLEYGFVAAVLPLAFWVADLYSIIRSLSL